MESPGGGNAPVLQRLLALKPSVQTGVALFVLFVCLALAAFSDWEIMGQRRHTIASGTVNAENLAKALDTYADNTLETADKILDVAVDLLEAEGTAPDSLPLLRSLLIGQASELSAAQSLTVYDQDGNWLIDSLLTASAQQAVPDRNYLSFIRSHADRGTHIGNLFRDASSGRMVLPVMRRFNHRDGSFAGIASIAIGLDYFQRFFASFAIGPNDVLQLFSRDGTILARHPAKPEELGLSAANGPVFERLHSDPAGSFVASSAQDDAVRLFAYRRLAHYPLVVNVALAANDLLAPWWSDAIKRVFILGTSSLAILYLGIQLSEQIWRRKAAENALHANDSRFRDMADTLPGVLFQLHQRADGSIGLNYVSSRATSLFGVSVEDLTIDWFSLPINPEDQPGWVSSLQDAVDNETEWSCEARLLQADGTEGWWRGLARPVRTGEGLFLNGVIIDSNAQKRLEVELREETALRQAVLDSANYAITALDRDGTITMFNRAAERLFGYTADEVVGRATQRKLHLEAEITARAVELAKGGSIPVDLATNETILELGAPMETGIEVILGAAAKGGDEEREWTLVTKDGKLVPALLSLAAIRDDKGENIGFVGIARDLTEIREAEAEAKRFHRLLDDAVESMQDRVLLYDADDRLVLANSAFRKTEGKYTGPLEPGTPMREILRKFLTATRKRTAPEEIEALVASMLEADRAPDAPPMERRLPDGSWSLVHSFPTSEGGVLVVATDITRLKEAAAEISGARDMAEAANRAKTAFLASMSHEIRTPLNGILGLAQILGDTPLSEEQKKQVSLLRSEGETLLALISDILDLSKVESGRLELEKITVSPASVVEGAVSILQPQAAAKGLVLRLEIDPSVPRLVVGDPARLRQILLNLVGNAIKFTKAGQVTVTVSTEAGRPGQTLRFRVADTGPGIPPDRQHLLFQPFKQMDPSAPRRFGGNGLGLAIAKRLVDAMNGTLGFESAEGKGSVFWFTADLPAAQSPELRVLSSDGSGGPVELPGRSARVLVAEDMSINQLVIQTMLVKAGHEVTLTANGEQAVAAAGKKLYDIILMDIEMPVMDGIEATRLIRGMEGPARNVPIIAVTANAMPEQIVEYRKAGVTGHIAKPINREELLATISRVATPQNDEKSLLPPETLPPASPSPTALLPAEAAG